MNTIPSGTAEALKLRLTPNIKTKQKTNVKPLGAPKVFTSKTFPQCDL